MYDFAEISETSDLKGKSQWVSGVETNNRIEAKNTAKKPSKSMHGVPTT